MNHLTTYHTTGWPRDPRTGHVPRGDRRTHLPHRARDVIRSILDFGGRPGGQEHST